MTQLIRTLLTGGTGFIGRHLIPHMAGRGREVNLAVREANPGIAGVHSVRAVGDLGANSAPLGAFLGIDVLIHLAGHVISKNGGPVEESHNVRMADIVATRAREAGVPKVLVLSSVAATVVERQPELARTYGREKLAADNAFLANLAPEQRVVFVRPPAVYGPGMGGALSTLSKLIARGIPLPFATAKAPRNYISVGNLTSLLDHVTSAPDEVWERADRLTFNIADARPVPTNTLVRMMGEASGHRVRLFPMPRAILFPMGSLLGKGDMISGAMDGLELADNGSATDMFGWHPTEEMPRSLAFLSRAN